MNQKRAHVAIAALADSEQHSSLAATVLTWHQSEPSAQRAPSFELPSITYRRNRCLRDQRTHALHPNQAAPAFVGLAEPRDPLVVAQDLLVESA